MGKTRGVFAVSNRAEMFWVRFVLHDVGQAPFQVIVLIVRFLLGQDAVIGHTVASVPGNYQLLMPVLNPVKMAEIGNVALARP